VTDLRDAALELARAGVAVFPCNADKSPRTPRGFHDATTDPARVSTWDWNGGGMIGAALAPGTIVVDVDPRNGGDSTLALLEGQGKTLPPTRTVRTKSGGSHHYYNVGEGVSLRGSLGPGVDVKRPGKGYVVVPPSPGYLFRLESEPVHAPLWLLEELVVPEKEGVEGEASDPKFFPWEKGTAYGLAAMERELGRLAVAQEGGRNEALNRAAFALAQLVAGGELEHDATLDALTSVAVNLDLEPGEIDKTTASGWEAGEQEPRQAPREVLDVAHHANPEATAEGLSSIDEHEAEETRFWVDWAVDEEAPPFFLHPLLPKRAYVLVYGATEAAKSMTWVGLLAEGSHRGVRSSVYSLENPPHTDRDRLRRWAPDPAHFRLTNEPLDMNDPRQLGALVERERDWGDGRPTDVVLIDTYSHAFNSRSEDGNAKAIEFARRVRHLMHVVGCSVVLIDHTGYAQEDEPRDASAKRQQVDVAILMKKAGEWRPGQPARFTMKNNKAARFANPFFLTGEIRDAKDADSRALSLGWQGDAPSWR
jgi:hypothetical protein